MFLFSKGFSPPPKVFYPRDARFLFFFFFFFNDRAGLFILASNSENAADL